VVGWGGGGCASRGLETYFFMSPLPFRPSFVSSKLVVDPSDGRADRVGRVSQVSCQSPLSVPVSLVICTLSPSTGMRARTTCVLQYRWENLYTDDGGLLASSCLYLGIMILVYRTFYSCETVPLIILLLGVDLLFLRDGPLTHLIHFRSWLTNVCSIRMMILSRGGTPLHSWVRTVICTFLYNSTRETEGERGDLDHGSALSA
jgi:hypothetical protein